MKKYYMKPTVKVAEIKDTILAGSGVTVSDNSGDGIDALSKRSSFADEDKAWGSIW